jgi:adenylate kinase family enzyme
MTIAIDGVDHSGKSTLSRFLAWQLGMPAIEIDLALIEGDAPVNHDTKLVKRLINVRHKMRRPVIVEGVFVLRLLKELDIEPDVVIRVENKSSPRPGSWPEEFAEYNVRYGRSMNPDYEYVW